MWKRSALGTAAVISLLVVSTPATAQPLSNETGGGDGFVLESTGGDLPDRVAKLDGKLPKLGVQNILKQANRKAEPGCTAKDQDGDPMPEKPKRSFCFNKGDTDTKHWIPQGVTTVADAQDDEHWGSKQPILASWYSNEDPDAERGVRVSFLDPDTNRYQHALLAYPYINKAGDPTYETLTRPQSGAGGKSIHAGGIVWYGNYLYVVDTYRGIRAFDMRKIMDLGAADNGDTSEKNKDKVGLDDGKYYGHGYRYVMPQVANWQRPDYSNDDSKDNVGCDNEKSPIFSYLSLDRSTKPDSLISGEYCNNGAKDTGRVARWPMNGGAGTPKARAGGRWKASSVSKLPTRPGDEESNDVRHVQGATSWKDTWYMSSTGSTKEKDHALQTATRYGGSLKLDGQICRKVAEAVEDLSYWPGRDEVWTVTEAEHNPDAGDKRVLYALPKKPQDDSKQCKQDKD